MLRVGTAAAVAAVLRKVGRAVPQKDVLPWMDCNRRWYRTLDLHCTAAAMKRIGKTVPSSVAVGCKVDSA